MNRQYNVVSMYNGILFHHKKTYIIPYICVMTRSLTTLYQWMRMTWRADSMIVVTHLETSFMDKFESRAQIVWFYLHTHFEFPFMEKVKPRVPEAWERRVDRCWLIKKIKFYVRLLWIDFNALFWFDPQIRNLHVQAPINLL